MVEGRLNFFLNFADDVDDCYGAKDGDDDDDDDNFCCLSVFSVSRCN